MTENQPHRVLVIDDVMLNRRLLTIHMKRFDVEYDESSNGLEALQRCETTNYDLLLVDMNMPEMDGLTFIKMYKKRYSNKPAYIVGISADVFTHDKQKFLDAGADTFIAKPVTKDVIDAVMTRFFEQGETINSEAQQPDEQFKTLNLDKGESLWGSHDVYLECLKAYLTEYEAYTQVELMSRLSSPDKVHAMKSLALTLGLDKLSHVFELYKTTLNKSPVEIEKLRKEICLEIEMVCGMIRNIHDSHS